MDDMHYNISFTTKDRDTWLGLNGKKIFMCYEEDCIESENFLGFAEQLMATWLGYTEIDI